MTIWWPSRHPAGLGQDPGHGRSHGLWAHQVCRRAAEDRVPGRRLLAKAGRAGQHPGRHGSSHAGHVRGQGVRRRARAGGGQVRPRSPLQQRDDRAVDSAAGTAVITDNSAGFQESLHYDLLHVVPPQSAPGGLKRTPLADPANPAGYVDVDQHTMQHLRDPEIFTLGDAGSTPNSKTGAAIRKQAPVLVENLLAALAGESLSAQFGGGSSCPLTTARGKMLLAEFDCSLQAAPASHSSTTPRNAATCGCSTATGFRLRIGT